MIRTFAAVNVGSFEIELGIYELSDKVGVRQIDHVKHITRLGRDAFQDNRISYPQVEELCENLEEFARIAKGYQTAELRAYATSALREAENRQIVIEQVRVRTGITIRVLSNSEQRFLSYKAIAAHDADFQKAIQKGTAIVDIGFGSMQVSLFDKDALVSTQNLPLGVLKLREMVFEAQVSQETAQDVIAEMVDNEMVTFRKMYLKDRGIPSLIGIGETILTLYFHVHSGAGSGRITLEEFQNSFDRLSRMTRDQIEEEFEVNAGYADLLFPTAVILKRMLEMTGAQTIWMPGTSMTDAIAAEYAEEKRLLKFNHNFDNDIIAASRNMAKRYKCHMAHIQAVEAAALTVFDSLKKYHGMKERERLLLQIAANLHSCGKFVTMRDPTDCAYNIIMATEIIGLSHAQREIVANVVRYNIQKFRYDDTRFEAQASPGSRLVDPANLPLLVAKLVAILRLANSMDRGHKAKLADCRVTVKGNRMLITTGYEGDVTLERLAIGRTADFFEEIFGIRPELRQKKKV
ncbi:MAG: exopolyphosphatase [Clostridiales bacterium]|nr:exopolyphosphatase [Clostridiales bacterium]